MCLPSSALRERVRFGFARDFNVAGGMPMPGVNYERRIASRVGGAQRRGGFGERRQTRPLATSFPPARPRPGGAHRRWSPALHVAAPRSILKVAVDSLRSVVCGYFKTCLPLDARALGTP